MKLRNRVEALEGRNGLPADLVICSLSEEAAIKRRNLPPEAVVIVTGVPRSTPEVKP